MCIIVCVCVHVCESAFEFKYECICDETCHLILISHPQQKKNSTQCWAATADLKTDSWMDDDNDMRKKWNWDTWWQVVGYTHTVKQFDENWRKDAHALPLSLFPSLSLTIFLSPSPIYQMIAPLCISFIAVLHLA